MPLPHRMIIDYTNAPDLIFELGETPVLVESASLQEILLCDQLDIPAANFTDVVTCTNPTGAQNGDVRVWQLHVLLQLTTPTSRVYPLTASDKASVHYVIGRHHTSDIVINERTVSRTHAHLTVDRNNTATLTDTKSNNGTRINQCSVTPLVPTKLSYGDCITFGRAVFYFVPARMFVNLTTDAA